MPDDFYYDELRHWKVRAEKAEAQSERLKVALTEAIALIAKYAAAQLEAQRGIEEAIRLIQGRQS